MIMVFCFNISISISMGNQYQSSAYFPKHVVVNVKAVEVIRALCLTTQTVEAVLFTVPSLKVSVQQT